MARYRAVLFDLDGTLVDTAPDLANALNTLRVQQGLAALPFPHIRPYASHGARGLLEIGFGITPEAENFSRLREQLLQIYSDNICQQSRLFPGVAPILTQLEEQGIPWGIVTNKNTRLTTLLLQQLQIYPTHNCLVCGDSTPFAKPHPAPLLKAAETLKIPPTQCLYVGDAERDIAAGLAAGMDTLVAGYGYIHDEETPAIWGATGIISHLSEVTTWLDP